MYVRAPTYSTSVSACVRVRVCDDRASNLLLDLHARGRRRNFRPSGSTIRVIVIESNQRLNQPKKPLPTGAKMNPRHGERETHASQMFDSPRFAGVAEDPYWYGPEFRRT